MTKQEKIDQFNDNWTERYEEHYKKIYEDGLPKWTPTLTRLQFFVGLYGEDGAKWQFLGNNSGTENELIAEEKYYEYIDETIQEMDMNAYYAFETIVKDDEEVEAVEA